MERIIQLSRHSPGSALNVRLEGGGSVASAASAAFAAIVKILRTSFKRLGRQAALPSRKITHPSSGNCQQYLHTFAEPLPRD